MSGFRQDALCLLVVVGGCVLLAAVLLLEAYAGPAYAHQHYHPPAPPGLCGTSDGGVHFATANDTHVALSWYGGAPLTPRRRCTSAPAPCWDVTHAPCLSEALPVFVLDDPRRALGDAASGYDEVSDAITDILRAQLLRAADALPPFVRLVNASADACVTLALSQSTPWAASGPNVLLVGANGWPGEHSDRPGVSFPLAVSAPGLRPGARFHAGLAIRGHLREGVQAVDVMLPVLRRDFFAPGRAPRPPLDAARERPLLAAFHGSVWRLPMSFYKVRDHLALLHNGRDIVVRGLCGERRDERADFAALLSNATFAFCPGGGGVDTFRFWEALEQGAIPVVFDDILLPFDRIVDWEPCVVRASSAALLAAPRGGGGGASSELEALLRGIGRRELEARRRACHALFAAHLATPAAVARSLLQAVRAAVGQSPTAAGAAAS